MDDLTSDELSGNESISSDIKSSSGDDLGLFTNREKPENKTKTTSAKQDETTQQSDHAEHTEHVQHTERLESAAHVKSSTHTEGIEFADIVEPAKHVTSLISTVKQSTVVDENTIGKDNPVENSDEHNTRNAVLAIEGPLPNEPTARRLSFGSHVEAVRREILQKRQMCKTKVEFDELFNLIDIWISQAKTAYQDTIAIRLLLDKAVVAHFGLDFNKALILSEDALSQADKLDSKDDCFQLQLVGKFVQSSVYSRQGESGRAWGMLQSIATQIKGSENSQDHWRLHYNMGTNLLARLKASNVKDDRIIQAGVEQFKLCRDAIRDGENKGQTYDIQDHFFALVMSAKMLLDLPEHKPKREFAELSHEKIMKAQNLLQLICTDYPAIEMVVRFKLRLFVTFAGLFYRRGQRDTKAMENVEARGQFTEAMLFLECASLFSKDSPYEEHKFIEEFLAYLREKTDVQFLHKDLNITTGMYRLDLYKEDQSAHELEDPESEGFTSDDFGNSPNKSLKTHRRRTKAVRHAQSTLQKFAATSVTSSTSLSSVSTNPSICTSEQYLTLDEDVLLKIEIENQAINPRSDSSTSSSTGGSLAGSFGSTSSASSDFRRQRDIATDQSYPVIKTPRPTEYKMSSETESSPEQWGSLSDANEEQHADAIKSTTHLTPEKHVQLNYRYLAKLSLNEEVFSECRFENIAFSHEFRKGILFEITYVQQYIAINRAWNHSKENTCIPLLVSAKLALDFPDSASGFSRFIVTTSDLKWAYQTIRIIKQTLPIYAGAPLKTELLIVLASYYYRACQLAATFKLVAMCKFSINMAVLYIEFAEIFAQHNQLYDKVKRITDFKQSLESISHRFFDKLETDILFNP